MDERVEMEVMEVLVELDNDLVQEVQVELQVRELQVRLVVMCVRVDLLATI